MAVEECPLEIGDTSVNAFISLRLGLASIFPSELTAPQKLIAAVETGFYDQNGGKNRIAVR